MMRETSMPAAARTRIIEELQKELENARHNERVIKESLSQLRGDEHSQALHTLTYKHAYAAGIRYALDRIQIIGG